jgi:hypothetical protein
MKEYRIVVCIDVEAEDAEKAYGKVYDMMMAIDPAQSWESSDEWFEDGSLMDEESVSQARIAVLAKGT